MPFKSVRRFFRKANQATAGIFNRDADELHGFEPLGEVKSLTLEINDWEPYEHACEAYISGNKTEFEPVYFSIFQAPEHILLFKARIEPDMMTVTNLEEKDDEDTQLIQLKLPEDKESPPFGESVVFNFVHPSSGLITYNVTQLNRQKNRFRVYDADADEKQPHLRVIKEATTKQKMMQKMGMSFSGTVTHIRDTQHVALGTIYPKISHAGRSEKILYTIEFSAQCPDYRIKALILCLCLMFCMRVAVRPLHNVMLEHHKKKLD